MARMEQRAVEQKDVGARILMVDDDPGICDVVSDFLGRHGYAVECAGDAREMEQALERG
ncbi:MAG: DNA-binding response regulator, partial [Phenylobacterium sp.]